MTKTQREDPKNHCLKTTSIFEINWPKNWSTQINLNTKFDDRMCESIKKYFHLIWINLGWKVIYFFLKSTWTMWLLNNN